MKQTLAFLLLSVSSFAAAPAPAIVTSTCSGCHGINGQAAALPSVPKLAGIDAAYLQKRIAAYQSQHAAPVDEALHRLIHFENSRANGPAANMVGVARSVSPAEMKSALTWYAAQTPSSVNHKVAPAASKANNLVTAYACESCHGEGLRGNAVAPRLAGQNATYIASQFELFRSGQRKSDEMALIAAKVDPKQAKLIAAAIARHP